MRIRWNASCEAAGRGALAGVAVLLLSGCSDFEPPGALLAADAASVAVFGRDLIDVGVSLVSGRDCSFVRLDRRQTYCAPEDRTIEPPFCTQSLGRVDCWASPELLPARREGVADEPRASPEQMRYRAARWPKSITGN